MTQTYEFKGKNVDAALEKASAELKVPTETLKHEVVAYGSSGIFGLVGVKKAIIKVFFDKEKKSTSRTKQVEKPNEVPPVSTVMPADPPSNNDVEAKKYDRLLLSGTGVLQKIIDQITSGATIQSSLDGGKLFYTILGGDSGVLIGKRGQTLEAIQYLLEKMINKRSTNRVRVVVDVEGYLQKRQNNLQQMASRMAEKAKRTKKPVTIGQMNAHDRRIVHIHLKNENGVRTQSIGDGYFRKLMIFPKKQGGLKSKNTHAKD